MRTLFLGKKTSAEGVMSFSFKKPEGFEYKSGQFLNITLVEAPSTDEAGNTRTFSLVSAPHEPEITIATRVMRDSAFKRNLLGLQPGSEVEITLPMGSFVLHNSSEKKAIFLISDIGITPVFSMAKDAAARQLPHKIFLFYSNKYPNDAAFLDQLQALQEKNPNFKLIATMTQVHPDDEFWQGETGEVTTDMIKKYVAEIPNSIWYLSGSQLMVKTMKKLLEGLGVDSDEIRTEEFPGY